MTPGMIRIQLSRFSDGATYFCLARTIHKDSGGYHAQQPVQAIGLGCRVEHARELVYSDGMDLENAHTGDAGGRHLPPLRAQRLRAAGVPVDPRTRCRSTRTCAASRSTRRCRCVVLNRWP